MMFWRKVKLDIPPGKLRFSFNVQDSAFYPSMDVALDDVDIAPKLCEQGSVLIVMY